MQSYLFACRSWQDFTGKWQRMVKMTPSARNDVMELEDALSKLLVDHQARAKAICHVREKFFLLVFGKTTSTPYLNMHL
jgi:hypothetical protein